MASRLRAINSRDGKTYYVYAMFDPRDNRVRYIGVSNDPDRRVKRHISKAHDADLASWIASLIGDGVKPEYRILDSSDSQLHGHWAEKWWIGMYSFVCPGQLLNKLWKVEFFYLYQLELDAKVRRIHQDRDAHERRWRQVELARIAIRRMLREGRRDVTEIATELGVVNAIVWGELYLLRERRESGRAYREKLLSLPRLVG